MRLVSAAIDAGCVEMMMGIDQLRSVGRHRAAAHRDGRCGAACQGGRQKRSARWMRMLQMAMRIFYERLPVHDAAPEPAPRLDRTSSAAPDDRTVRALSPYLSHNTI